MTRLGCAIGFKPENNIIGPKIITMIPINPSHPIDFRYQG
jgi:hypothetical protein